MAPNKRKREDSTSLDMSAVPTAKDGEDYTGVTPGIENQPDTWLPFDTDSIDEKQDVTYRLESIPHFRNLSCRVEGIVHQANLPPGVANKNWPFNFVKSGASSSNIKWGPPAIKTTRTICSEGLTILPTGQLIFLDKGPLSSFTETKLASYIKDHGVQFRETATKHVNLNQWLTTYGNRLAPIKKIIESNMETVMEMFPSAFEEKDGQIIVRTGNNSSTVTAAETAKIELLEKELSDMKDAQRDGATAMDEMEAEHKKQMEEMKATHAAAMEEALKDGDESVAE